MIDEEEQKERIQTEYWIDIYGVIHRWKGSIEHLADCCSVHYAIANAIVPDAKNPDDVLMRMGWIKWGSKCGLYQIDNEPTQAQMNTLFGEGYRVIFGKDGTKYSW